MLELRQLKAFFISFLKLLLIFFKKLSSENKNIILFVGINFHNMFPNLSNFNNNASLIDKSQGFVPV